MEYFLKLLKNPFFSLFHNHVVDYFSNLKEKKPILLKFIKIFKLN